MAPSNKPNVVFIMVDQLSAKWLEAADNGICGLPNLDRLRRRGVSFSNAFANNPLCCPARATIATGLTCRGHGLLTNGYRLNPSVPTFMKTLQNAGWRTGAFGKVHFYPFDSEMYPYPDYKDYGFDVNNITEDNRTGEWLDWIETEHPSYYDAVLATMHGWALELPYFAAYGKKKIDLRDRIRRAIIQLPWAEGSHVGAGKIGEGYFPLPFPEEISQTNWITDRAIEFIDGAPNESPIYAHISYVQPHSPSCPPIPYLDNVNEELIPEPLGGEPVDARYQDAGFDWHFMRKLYFADLIHLDLQIGRIMDRLEQTGRIDNTFILFTSDHGEMFMDHGHLGKGGRHYDSCIRIPLIIAGPGAEQGASCGGQHVSDWRESAYIESYGTCCQSPSASAWTRTLRNGQFRYSVSPGNNRIEELYDLTSDPGELKNVVNDSAYKSARLDLLDSLLERTVFQDYQYPPRDLCVLGAH